MKKLTCLILAATAILTFSQCDDTTDTVGNSTIADQDFITARTDTFFATSSTITANDSILANTSDVYLGKYTDATDKTTLTSSFITQFACTENFTFPEEGVVGDSATYTILRLYIDSYYGDSLNAMRCEVHALDKVLDEGTPYYTNFAPEEFYDTGAKPLASKVFNVIDFTEPDSILEGEYTKRIDIRLPNSIGNRFINLFYETTPDGKRIGKEYFANSEAFINNVFKGVYVKCTQGDGTLVKIFRSRLDIGFDRLIKSSSGEMDSIQNLTAPFYSGKEVMQVNKFANSNIDILSEESGHTYIKTPAGLFTEITLPVVDVIENCDTINSAKISFERYNEGKGTPYTTILMVRKSEMYRFFLKNGLHDNKTSYLTNISSDNKYTFDNISEILKRLYKEYKDGTAQDSNWETNNPDWNKVVLIPVKTTSDSYGNTLKIIHDISLASIKLRGGDAYQIPIQIVTSKFND